MKRLWLYWPRWGLGSQEDFSVHKEGAGREALNNYQGKLAVRWLWCYMGLIAFFGIDDPELKLISAPRPSTLQQRTYIPRIDTIAYIPATFQHPSIRDLKKMAKSAPFYETWMKQLNTGTPRLLVIFTLSGSWSWMMIQSPYITFPTPFLSSRAWYGIAIVEEDFQGHHHFDHDTHHQLQQQLAYHYVAILFIHAIMYIYISSTNTRKDTLYKLMPCL